MKSAYFGFAQYKFKHLRSEKGALSLIVLILLLLGIAVGVYLVQSKSNFFTQFLPKAGGAGVLTFVDKKGNPLAQTYPDGDYFIPEVTENKVYILINQPPIIRPIPGPFVDVGPGEVVLEEEEGVEVVSGGEGGSEEPGVKVNLKSLKQPKVKVVLSEDPSFPKKKKKTTIPFNSYPTITSFTLSKGDGVKTIYAKFVDKKGKNLFNQPPFIARIKVGGSTSCVTGLQNITYSDRCGENLFRFTKYTCADGSIHSQGGSTSCKDQTTWKEYAFKDCQNFSSCPTSGEGCTTNPDSCGVGKRCLENIVYPTCPEGKECPGDPVVTSQCFEDKNATVCNPRLASNTNQCTEGYECVVEKDGGVCRPRTSDLICGGLAGEKCPDGYSCLLPPTEGNDLQGVCVKNPPRI